MSIPGSANPLLLATAAAAAETFQISRSLRFDSGSTSSLTKTFSSNGDRQKWTFSFWIKRSKLGTKQQIFGCQGTSDGDYSEMYFDTDDKLFIRFGYTSVVDAKPAAVFRDVSAWYHIVIALDTQNSTANDRLRVYVNGTELDDYSDDSRSSFTGTYGIGRAGAHKISGEPNGSGSHIDGYMTEIHYVNGSQKAPTDFGEVDSNNNWNPKEYSGTYGTNGFYLKCADNTSNASLGTDSSGNSNTFTVNNLVADAPGLGTSHQGFDAVTYSGTGSSRSVSTLSFQPDLVWIKNYSDSTSHMIFDAVRGVQKVIYSNATTQEQPASISVTSFNSDGFTVGSANEVNGSGDNIVAWCWKADGAGSALNTGSINATVSANTTYGFSIIKYQGSGSNGTVAHGLGAVPKMFFGRNLEDTSGSLDWIVYHESVGNTGRLKLNTTGSTSTSSTFFQDTSPTSSVISIGTSNDINKSGDDYILYCWSEVSGFSKFGSYSGNGQTLGPKITTNFKPKLVVIKRTDSAGNWEVYDSARSLDKDLKWNTNETEGTAPIIFDTDGFQTNYATGSLNASGGSYVYMAFASKPDGTPIDSLIDTPTNADADSGNNIGNYATLNPLSKGSAITLANGNLDISAASSGSQRVWGTVGVSTGKWYFEFTQSSGTYAQGVGIKSSAAQDNNDNYFYTGHTGQKVNASGTASSYGATWGNDDVIGVAFDLDAGTITFYKNGASQGQAFSGITDATYFPYVVGWSGGAWGGFVNFGQRPFEYTPPTGYKSLCTQNLSDPDIDDGSTIFDAKTWTGTGATRNITSYGFSPDWVWIKQTDTTRSHNTFDTVRTASKPLFIDLQNAELNDGRLTGFLSNGFTLDSDNAVNDTNGSYVGFAWDAGTTTASNTDGSGPTNVEVRASQTNGFSIVKYTGNGSSGSVGHGLSVAPEWIVIKNRDASSHWHVYHVGLTSGKRLNFSNSEAEFTPGTAGITTVSNTTFTLGSSRAETNASGNDYIAYCWSPVSQFNAFGKYTGNGSSSDGPFVFTGMRPRFILFKRIDAASNWRVHDTAREDYNPHDTLIFPDQNSAAAENSVYRVDILSNGFKVRNNNSNFNSSGGEYIYCAFAEHPFKTSRAR